MDLYYMGEVMRKPRKKKHKEVEYAWAINTRYTDIDGKYYPGFLGIYYFGHPKYPDHCLGNTTALFKTREIARKYKKDSYFKDAMVRKVRIVIEEI